MYIPKKGTSQHDFIHYMHTIHCYNFRAVSRSCPIAILHNTYVVQGTVSWISAVIITLEKLAGFKSQEAGLMKCHSIVFVVLWQSVPKTLYPAYTREIQWISHFAAAQWILLQRSLRACAHHMTLDHLISFHVFPWQWIQEFHALMCSMNNANTTEVCLIWMQSSDSTAINTLLSYLWS